MHPASLELLGYREKILRVASNASASIGLGAADREIIPGHRFAIDGAFLNISRLTAMLFQLASHKGRQLQISRGQSELGLSHGLLVVPSEEDVVRIGVESVFATPLYWRAPAKFHGDR